MEVRSQISQESMPAFRSNIEVNEDEFAAAGKMKQLKSNAMIYPKTESKKQSHDNVQNYLAR